MRETSASQATDLIEADLGPGTRRYFTTRGLRALPVVPEGGADAAARGSDEETGVYSDWNLALHVGDDPQRVRAHRHRLEELLGLEPEIGRAHV